VKVCLLVMVIRATFTLKYIMLGKYMQAIKHGTTRKLNHVLEQFLG